MNVFQVTSEGYLKISKFLRKHYHEYTNQMVELCQCCPCCTSVRNSGTQNRITIPLEIPGVTVWKLVLYFA